MTVTPFECPAEWTNECGCPESHNYCWPEPLVSCCPELQVDDTTPPDRVAIIENAKRVAVEVLHAFSGRQFGLCVRKVRPCRDGCRENGPVATAWVDGQLRPLLDGGIWYNRDVCGTCGPTGCGCAALCEVTLPGLVQEIVEVRVNGLVVSPSMYRVDNHRKLVRTSFGPLMLTQWESLGGGAAFATQSDAPAHAVQIGGGVVVNPDGTLNLPSQPGPYALNFGLPNRVQQRIKLDLEPWAELTLPVGWTVEQIESLGPDSTVFQTGGEVRGGQFGGWVIITGSGQSPILLLPDGPNNIGEERGGADIDYVSYVDDNRPGACWPKCQDLSRPDTEDNTFSVTYKRGVPVPHAGRWAAGLLACELVKACSPDAGECQLPDNVTTIVREGVTMELAPFIIGGADGKIQFGRTGVPEVDLWLIAVNPHKIRSRSRAYSPDRPNPRRQTYPCP